MNLPNNVINFTTTIFGNTQLNIEEAVSNYDIHVIAVAFQQEKDLSDTYLYCDSDVVATNYGKDFGQVFMDYRCDSKTFYLDKSGVDEAWVNVLYTTTTPTYTPLPVSIEVSAENGTTTVNLPQFTYGDIVMSMFLLLIFTILFFGGIWNAVMGVKKKRNSYNKFLYNSPEGKGEYID